MSIIDEPPESSVDIGRLFGIVWGQKLLISVFSALGLVAAIVYLHFTPFLYTVTSQVTALPTAPTGSGMASRLGGLSSLASLAGVSLPSGQGTDQFQLYIEGLHARFAADGLSKNDELMKVVFPGEWDEDTHSWRKPIGLVTLVGRVVKPLLGIPSYPYQPPNGARLQPYLLARVNVSTDIRSPIVTITYDSRDPNFGVKFLKALNDVVDTELRHRALSRSAFNIAYLSDKLKTVTIAEQREALAQTLSEQTRSAMMAGSGAPFSVENFGPPSASFMPTQPKPLIILVTGLLAGLAIGVGLAFINGTGLLGWLMSRLRR